MPLALALPSCKCGPLSNQGDSIWKIKCESKEWSKMESIQVPSFRDEQTKAQSTFSKFKHNPLVAELRSEAGVPDSLPSVVYTPIASKWNRNFHYHEIFGKMLILLSLGCGVILKHTTLTSGTRNHTGCDCHFVLRDKLISYETQLLEGTLLQTRSL